MPWAHQDPVSCCRGKAHRQGDLALLGQAQSPGQATTTAAGCHGPSGQPMGQKDTWWRTAPPCPITVCSLRVQGEHVLMA